MKTNNMIVTILLFMTFTVLVTSCASTKKCDGRKAVKTPMGNL